MATITLYADKINNMPGLIWEAKSAVKGFNTQLGTLKRKCEKVNASACNIDDVIRTISASTRTQEDKIEALEAFNENVEDFARETVETDEKVAEIVNRNKDNFYDKYSYLKPDCEKSVWEKIKDGLKKVGEWCKEHWAAIVTLVVAVVAVIAIVAISIVTFGTVTPVLLAAAIGAAVSFLGQVGGDLIKFVKNGLTTGEWKWPGTWQDYVGAAIGGAVGGILTLICGPGNPLPAAVDAMLSSLITNSLKDLSGDESMTLEELWLDATVNAVTALALGKLFDLGTDKLSKLLSENIPALSRLAGRGSYSASYKMVLTKLKNGTIKHFTNKTIANGILAGLSGDFLKNIVNGFTGLDEKAQSFFKTAVRQSLIYGVPGVISTLPLMPPVAVIPPVIMHRLPTFQIAPILRPLPGFRPHPVMPASITPTVPKIIIRTILPMHPILPMHSVPGFNPLAV